jgi:(5-formylfuran-3-yl)methyl phosphate synthase
MRLLVSVRSGEEVAAALAGGADIIDAKEPARGSLGAVTPAVLSAIAGHTPAWVPLSVALGDCNDLDELRAAMDAARPPERFAPVYLKLGFAGTRSLGRITALLELAVTTANPHGIVAVGYADHGAAGTLSPEDVLGAAVTAGARGLLVDTWRKDGRALLDHLSIERLASLSVGAHCAGLLFALAGSLDGEAIARLAGLADIVGVRGAACQGGRSGAVNAGCVAELRRRLGTQAPVLVR